MKTTFDIFRAAALATLWIAGASASSPAIDRVGPARAADATDLSAGAVILRVFSDTYKVAAGRGGSAASYPHSGYVILEQNGVVLQHVDNHGNGHDELPIDVPLPAGLYLIKARSAAYGSITVPVQIVAGKLTPVFLTAGGMPNALQPAGRELVRLPNSQVIGVRSSKSR